MHALLLIIKGAIIGVASIIPSVSGGTLAVVLGLYDRLILSISQFFKLFKNRKLFKETLSFLVPIGIGVLIGVLVAAQVLGSLLVKYPVQMQFIFVGLIAGSLPFIARQAQLKKLTPSKCLGFFFGLLVMGLFYYLETKGYNGVETHQIVVQKLTATYGLKLIVCGFIAAGALLIPGISGSLILLLMGEYGNILYYINTLVGSVPAILKGNANWELILNTTLLIAVFVVGIALGAIIFAKIITWALKNYHNFTMGFICGLLIISIVAIWPGFVFAVPAIFINLTAILGGFLIAFFLGRKE